MRVSRSLTIKQMAMIASLVIVCTFACIIIQLSYFIEQSRKDTMAQMEDIAFSMRSPVAKAILKGDINQAREILNQLQPAGIVSQTSIMLPEQLQVLQVQISEQQQIPDVVTRLLSLPIKTTVPLFALQAPGTSQPLAYLTLSADSGQVYRFFINTLSMLLTSYLLLALILTVGITWCINRLVVHPLRQITAQLTLFAHQGEKNQLLPELKAHSDDEIGLLIRSYNRYQQVQSLLGARLVGKAEFTVFIEQSLSRKNPGALLVIESPSGERYPGVSQVDAVRAHLFNQIGKNKLIFPDWPVVADLAEHHLGLLIENIDDPWTAMKFAQQVSAHFERSIVPVNHDAAPSLSIGIAMLHPDLPVAELYQRALTACHCANQQKSHHIQFFDLLSHTAAIDLNAETKRAIGGLNIEQFAVWLQPQINMRSGEIVGAEVLLRQRQTNGSWSLPEGLIERIEECGLMMSIGRWILDQTAQILSQWQTRGITLPLCVNLSVFQLMHKDIQSELITLLDRYAIQPGRLNIEVTESSRIEEPQFIANVLRPLHDAGIGVALDDFGMGYAGLRELQYMKSIPVDTLKLDKSFVSGLPDDHMIASIIITMANMLGLQVMAEGVEHESQKIWLLDQGVTSAQGFLFSEALPLVQFEQRYLA